MQPTNQISTHPNHLIAALVLLGLCVLLIAAYVSCQPQLLPPAPLTPVTPATAISPTTETAHPPTHLPSRTLTPFDFTPTSIALPSNTPFSAPETVVLPPASESPFTPMPTETITVTPTLRVTATPVLSTLPVNGGDALFVAQSTGDLSGVLSTVDLLMALVAGVYFSRFMNSIPQWRTWNPGTAVKRAVFIALTVTLVGLLGGLKSILLQYWDTLGPVFQAVLISATAVLATQLAFELSKIAGAVGANSPTGTDDPNARAEWGRLDLQDRG